MHKKVVVDNFSTGSLKIFKQPWGLVSVNWRWFTKSAYLRKTCVTLILFFHQGRPGSFARSIHDPISTHQANVNSFVNLLVAVTKAQVKNDFCLTSSSVYRTCLMMSNKITVGEPLSPLCCNQAYNEIYADIFAQTYQQDLIGLRYFNVFGRPSRWTLRRRYSQIYSNGFGEEISWDYFWRRWAKSRLYLYRQCGICQYLGALTNSPRLSFFNIACGQSIFFKSSVECC